MKFIPSQLAYLIGNQSTKRDLKLLWKFLIFLAVLWHTTGTTGQFCWSSRHPATLRGCVEAPLLFP